MVAIVLPANTIENWKIKKKINMPLTYEQLKPAMYKQARYFARKSYGRFQTEELVAEVWLIGRIQKLKSIKLASARAKHDIIDYMRTQNGRKGHREYEFNKSITSLQTAMGDSEDDRNLEVLVASKADPGFEQTETKDLFDRLCRGLCRQETLILKLRFIEDMRQTEIGKALDLSESRVSQLLTNLLPRIRIILENLKLTQNRNNRRKAWENPFKSGTPEYSHIMHQRRQLRENTRLSRKRQFQKA